MNQEVFALAKEDAVIMHPGPINRGVEMSNDLADCERSLVILARWSPGWPCGWRFLYLLAGGSHAAN